MVRFSQLFISIGMVIQAVESLVERKLFSLDGLYDWTIISTNYRWMTFGPVAAVLNRIFLYRPFVAMICLQLAAALTALLVTLLNPAPGVVPNWLQALVAGLLLVTHMLFVLRNQYGLDGSDQMMLLVLAGQFAYRLHPTPNMLIIAFGFIAAQLILSYLTAGIAKAISPVWRSGKAIGGILDTRSYGSAQLAGVLQSNHWAALAVCWGTILYECLGPLIAFVHPTLGLAFLAGGFLLHFSIAAAMGLNIFMWSFLACYPAVFFFTQRYSLLGA